MIEIKLSQVLRATTNKPQAAATHRLPNAMIPPPVRLTAAIFMENPYCSRQLTDLPAPPRLPRVRSPGTAESCRSQTPPLPCVSTAFVAKTPHLPCVSTAFVAKTPPLSCVSTAFAAETPPLPCVSTAFVAKTSPLPCVSTAFVAEPAPFALWCPPQVQADRPHTGGPRAAGRFQRGRQLTAGAQSIRLASRADAAGETRQQHSNT